MEIPNENKYLIGSTNPSFKRVTPTTIKCSLLKVHKIDYGYSENF